MKIASQIEIGKFNQIFLDSQFDLVVNDIKAFVEKIRFSLDRDKKVTYHYTISYSTKNNQPGIVIEYNSSDELLNFAVTLKMISPNVCEIYLSIDVCNRQLIFYPESQEMLLDVSGFDNCSLNFPYLDSFFDLGSFVVDKVKDYFIKFSPIKV